jgi:hypothetical protein
MSLKKNILANYISQIYVTVIGIVMVPLYLNYMGAEAYGLIGFFSMLQAWFNLLDMGLTPTMARETARFRGGAIDALSYRRLCARWRRIPSVAIAGGGAMFVPRLYRQEIAAGHSCPLTRSTAVHLMAAIIALRWMCSLYRGAMESERLVWLGWYNSFIATLRFIGVLPVLIFIGATSTIFSFHLCSRFGTGSVAVASLLYITFHPSQIVAVVLGNLLEPVPVFLTIAFTSFVWVMVTQTDKLVLSTLALAEYGYLLAVLVVVVRWSLVAPSVLSSCADGETEAERPCGPIRVYRQSQ